MPVKVTVGLSRKLTEDFNSKGFDLHVEAELPASLIEDPNGMAQATNNLFQLAEDLLTEQINKNGGNGPTNAKPSNSTGPKVPEPPAANRNGSHGHNGRQDSNARNNNGHGSGDRHRTERSITEAQQRAINNMAKRLDQDGDACAHEEFGVALQELSIKQGSQLIDLLKKQIEGAKEPAGATR